MTKLQVNATHLAHSPSNMELFVQAPDQQAECYAIKGMHSVLMQPAEQAPTYTMHAKLSLCMSLEQKSSMLLRAWYGTTRVWAKITHSNGPAPALRLAAHQDGTKLRPVAKSSHPSLARPHLLDLASFSLPQPGHLL